MKHKGVLSGIGLLGLVGLCLCVGLVLAMNRAEPRPPRAAAPELQAVAAAPTLPPVPTDPPVPTATPEPTFTPIPTATPAPPQAFEGAGDAVLNLAARNGAAVVWVQGNGAADHFAVAGYDAQGELSDLLVNTTEPYQGTTWLKAAAIRLEVNAAGPWSIVVSSLAKAAPQAVPGQMAGEGDAVLALLAPADTARFSGNQAARNFAVIGYNEAGRMVDLLVNTTEPYEGQVLVRPGIKYMVVTATGGWQLAIE